MDFKGELLSAKEFSSLTGFLKKMGDKCLISLKDDDIKIVAYTPGSVNISTWMKVDPDSIFSQYLLEQTTHLFIQTRDLHQMIYAVSQNKSATVELIRHTEQPFLRFTSQSSLAEEVGELDVDIASEAQVRDIKEPGAIIPDVCLNLPPINTLVNFVAGYSRKIEMLKVSATRDGYLQLSVNSAQVTAELVTTHLQKPRMNINIPETEDPGKVFSVNVRSKQVKKFLNCRMLNVEDIFFSIKDQEQLNFFVFFSMGNGIGSSMSVHVPLFIQ